MIIYIRHSHDEYDDATHRHDHQITPLGKEKARRMGKKLIEKYGLPNLIYCSPFKRTRQTLKYMLKDNIPVVPATGSAPLGSLLRPPGDRTETVQPPKTRVKYDANLSRYFNRQEQEDPSIFAETEKLDIPIKETKNEFKLRVDEHINEITSLHNDKQIIWCITHTLVLKRVAKHYNIDIPKHLEFMEYFVATKIIESQREVSCPRCGKIHK